MKLFFLGGADEVGASCTLVEMEGHRILVDAGIRMGAAPGAHLPNLSVLDDVGPPEEVLVTHAHVDHTGALPVLAAGLPPGTAIRYTPATQAIAGVLLADAARIMAQRGEQEGELPLYPPEAVQMCLGRGVPVPFLCAVPICDGALRATWIPAGHILGAASIHIEGAREGLLISGDVCLANQRTIPGMVVPDCRPDVVVVESTYGNRQHADRAQQETALALRVAEVVAAGGKVLIPAFAVGRAQEVVLILSGAMGRGDIPGFPVFVDGMVRSVNAVYAGFVDELSPPLRRRVSKGDNAFYSDTVRAVSVPADRERALEGPPCCIVASSGMLVGGASSFYAARLAGDADNLIAITGYQDEESPGRALLNLAGGPGDEERVLMLSGRRVSVSCQVETYSLSAHADSAELASLVRRLSPQSACLVHGDDAARAALASAVDIHLPHGVHLPVNGGTYSTEPGAGGPRRLRYGRSAPMHGISGGREVDSDCLWEVRAYVLETGLRGPFRAQELAEMWHGTDGIGPPRVEAFKSLLDESQTAFLSDHRRPYLYRVAEEAGEASDGPLEMNEVRKRIEEAFPPESGLFRCSAHVDEGAYELAFHFPDAAGAQYGDRIRTLEEETGWRIRLRGTPHQGRLFEEAVHAVPDGATVLKTPALRLERREVALEVEVPAEIEAGWDETAREAERGFRETTGYDLRLVRQGAEAPGTSPEDPEGAWEINQAYAEIRRAFEGRPHAPYRLGRKHGEAGAYIEAAFVSPAVGELYRDVLDALAGRIGWAIRVRESANQEEIAREARRLTPDRCRVRGAPKLFLPKRRVVVPVVENPADDEQPGLREAFRERTGLDLAWEEIRV